MKDLIDDDDVKRWYVMIHPESDLLLIVDITKESDPTMGGQCDEVESFEDEDKAIYFALAYAKDNNLDFEYKRDSDNASNSKYDF